MGLYGGTNVVYQQPNIPKDDTFANYLKYQQDKDDKAQIKADALEKEQKDTKAARNAVGATAYAPFKANLTTQLQQGLIGFPEATQQLRDYASKYEIAPPEQDIQELTTEYTTKLLPQRRKTFITSSYQDVMGRAPTEQEIAAEQARFTEGVYGTNQDLLDRLAKNPEVTKKLNNNYLDNYYDVVYGKQEKDASGALTGKRTFKFDPKLLPTAEAGSALAAGVKIPQFGESFTGTPTEIEQQLSSIRDTRQFLYSAGLTNLQGNIDKETQKLKNEGSKDVARIQRDSSILSNLVSGFWG